MSEASPRISQEQQRHPSRRIAAGLASIALLPAAAGVLAPSAEATPVSQSAHELTSPLTPAGKSREMSTTTERAAFTKIMNARVRQSAIRFGKTPNVGPAKPGMTYESYVGPNRLLIRNYGRPPGPYGDKGYSITTIAPVNKEGNSIFSKLIETEIRAGNRKIGFIQDYVSGDWVVDWEVTKRSGESTHYVAAADIETALGYVSSDGGNVVQLTQQRLNAASETALAMQHDLLNAQPVGKYPNPLK